MKTLKHIASASFAALALLLTVSAAQAAPASMTRDAIIDLAKSGVDYSYWWGHGRWRTDDAQHGSCSGSCPDCTHSGSYGADCSGFVAKVWQVPSPSPVTTDAHPYSTREFRYNTTHWSQISRGNAVRADAMVYRNSANTGGHVLLYESGDPWGSMWAYEAKGCSPGIVRNLRTCSSSYIAIRRDLIASAPATGAIKGSVFVDRGDGSMDLRIPGASVTSSGAGSATARADDAIWTLTANPGTYTVTASAPGYESSSRSCAVSAGTDTWCSIGLVPSCVPSCGGKQCGDDGCGGSCGSCGSGESCQAGQCVCVPDCDGKTCGGDGCGGTCGLCPAGEGCDDGQCVCQPDCSGLECGPDPVCGESCGLCAAGSACEAGVCACQQECGERECGLDPVCGEGCGLCGAGEMCNPDGRCVDASSCEPDCSGRVCGTDPVCGQSCGTCAIEQICAAGACTDIDPNFGKVYGEVYEAKPLNDTEYQRGPPVARAQVAVIDDQSTTTDENGYYELQLRPGLIELEAVAEGFYRGRIECELGVGLAIECDIPLIRQEDAQQQDIQAAQKSRPETYEVGGYGCAMTRAGTGLWLLGLLLPALRRRRC